VSAAVFDEAGSNGPTPTEVRVDLDEATVEVRDPPAAATQTGLAACEPIPYEDPAGQNGCSCSVVAASSLASGRAGRIALLDLILAAIR
jgi:hypothetical protein